MWVLILIMAYISLSLVVQVLVVKTTCGKSICPESYGGVTFYLGALFEGRMWSLRPIIMYISLIIGRRGLDVKATYGKSCAPNFWVGSDLTFNPSFKVERGP